MAEAFEATKTGGRIAIFGAISTLVTYGINRVLPDLPGEVSAAILIIILAVLAWVDNYIHESKSTELKGILPF